MADLAKQPSEVRLFAFNFSGKMDGSATIVSVTSVTKLLVSGGGVDSLTIDDITASGQRVAALFGGGSTGQRYKLTCLCVDSDDQVLEFDGHLRVKEL